MSFSQKVANVFNQDNSWFDICLFNLCRVEEQCRLISPMMSYTLGEIIDNVMSYIAEAYNVHSPFRLVWEEYYNDQFDICLDGILLEKDSDGMVNLVPARVNISGGLVRG